MTTTQPRPTTTPEIGGIGHSVKRIEDDRFIAGQGNYLDDHTLPGMLHMAILRSPVAHARIKSIDTSAAAAMDGVVAVVTGELLASYGLAWMPTLSGDTQAVLATDKVRFQGQEVAAVVATDPYVAEDALELIDVDYEILPAITTPQQALADGAVVIRDEKEGQTDNLVYEWESGDAGGDRRRVRAGRPDRDAGDALPALAPVAAGDVRHPRRRQLGERPGDHLHDVAGAARAPHGVRDGGGPARAEHPDHQPRHRRRLRQQGAGVPGVRGGDGGVAGDRQAGEVGGEPQREPHLDRVRPRLPHEGRAGAHERRDASSACASRCCRTRARSTPTRSRPSSRPACSTWSPAATTIRPRT